MEMNQEWIDQYNKKCAEFIGANPCKDCQGYDGYEHPDWYHTQWSNRYQDNLELYSYKYSDLQFDSDWNWIMEVVQKIRNEGWRFDTSHSGSVSSKDICVFIWQKYVGGGETDLIECENSDVKLATIQAIDHFIDWYNKQKEL